ncbi:hypothetical protein V8C86DRAFT_2536342, partial [Haematococcus lacustris]
LRMSAMCVLVLLLSTSYQANLHSTCPCPWPYLQALAPSPPMPSCTQCTRRCTAGRLCAPPCSAASNIPTCSTAKLHTFLLHTSLLF